MSFINKAKTDTPAYVPGDLTDDAHRLDSHDLLVQNKFQQDLPKPKGYPKYRQDFSEPLPQIKEETINRNEVEREYQRHKTMAEATYTPPSIGVKNGRKKPSTPIISAIKNFQLAKRLHRENLEHDPLPDTIAHSKYRKLQMQRSQEPGLALEDEKYASAVGYKGYPGYGPTRCTKLKVYRPKTCGHCEKAEVKNDGRPCSVTSFDRKWRFIRRRKVSPIELAICWDLTPENPKDEPKRTPHLDGSNGSLAPAVFSLVHTPKEEEVEEASRKSSLDSGSLFEKRPVKDPNDKDFILDRPKTSHPRRTSRDSSQSGESLAKKRATSAYNLNNQEIENHDRKTCKNCGVYQSTPNLSECGRKKVKNSRLCMACEMKNVSIKDRRPKDEYKMAFKAGVPQNKCTDKRQDYPEHWRLATVYQHSYKPIHARKRPLLATVFK